jgi:WD40 repeat protein
LLYTLGAAAGVKLFSIAFAPGAPSRFVNAGGSDGFVYIWNLEAPRNDPRTARAFDDAVHSISFARGTSGEYAAAGLNGRVNFFFFDRGRQTKSVLAHKKALRVAYSVDGRRLASSGTGDENLRLWDAARRDIDRSLPGHRSYTTAIGWAANGEQLVSGGGGDDNTVKVWNVSTGQMVQEFPGHSKQRGVPRDVEGVAFHPLGNRIVSVGEDGMLKLWQAGKPQELLTAVPFNAAEFLTFAGDGCYAASPGVDRSVRVRLEGRETGITGDQRRALHVPEGFGYMLKAR